MKAGFLISAIALALGAMAPNASADIQEMRLGVVGNIRDDHGTIEEGKEKGANIELEAVFDSPGFLKILGSPRPYVMGSFATNTDGVNFGGVGLYWRWEFLHGWALEPGFGYIIHDGKIDDPYPPGSPAGIAYENDNQLLGSRDLFRDSLALEREFGDRVALQLTWEHMSHGQILGSGRNQGLDYVGVRTVVRFTPDPAN